MRRWGAWSPRSSGFRYVDEEIVERAAAKLDVPVDLVADAESRRSLTRRVLEELMRDASGISMMSGGVPTPSEARSSEDYRALIEQVVRETAEEGQVVIVAHAASIPLAGRPGLVRVLVTASPDVRATRLAGELDLQEPEAKKLVKESDLRADRLPEALLRREGRDPDALRPRRQYRPPRSRGGSSPGTCRRRGHCLSNPSGRWTPRAQAPMLSPDKRWEDGASNGA